MMTPNLLLIAIAATVFLTLVITVLTMRRRTSLVVPPQGFSMTPVVTMSPPTARLARGTGDIAGPRAKRPSGIRPSHASRSLPTT